jgi:hypothetical protein
MQQPYAWFVCEHEVGAVVPPELDPDDDPLLELELLLEPLELPELLLLLLLLDDELLLDPEDEPLLELDDELLLEPLDELPELLLLELDEDDEVLPLLLVEEPTVPLLELVEPPELLPLLDVDDPLPLELPCELPPTHTLTGVSVPAGTCASQVSPDGQGCDESQNETHVPWMHTRSSPHVAIPCEDSHRAPALPGPLAMHE